MESRERIQIVGSRDSRERGFSGDGITGMWLAERAESAEVVEVVECDATSEARRTRLFVRGMAWVRVL